MMMMMMIIIIIIIIIMIMMMMMTVMMIISINLYEYANEIVDENVTDMSDKMQIVSII